MQIFFIALGIVFPAAPPFSHTPKISVMIRHCSWILLEKEEEEEGLLLDPLWEYCKANNLTQNESAVVRSVAQSSV